MTNPLPDWYVEKYPHAVRPDGRQLRRAGASILYAGHLEFGTRPMRVQMEAPSAFNWQRLVEQAERMEDQRSAPRLLRLELWWMRQRLRWTARPGFRLVVLVPTA